MPPDLLAHPCVRVRLPNGALFRWRFERNGEPLQIDVKGPVTLDEASLVRETVLEGMALGYMIEGGVRDDIAAGRLVCVLDDWMPPPEELCLYYPGRRNASAAHKAFVDLARELGRSRTGRKQAETAKG